MLRVRHIVLTLAGAAIGGAVGYYAFLWLLHSHSLYGLVLPGGLMGIGASVGRARSWILGVVVCLAAVFLGLVAEWVAYPFRADASFGYFLTHLPELQPWTKIMIVVGGIIGFLGPLDLVWQARRKG